VIASNFVAMIPARIGSTRLRMKNLALIAGKPMIVWAIEAAVGSGAFDRVVVNADHALFGEIARRCGVEFYLRHEALGGSATKSDDVVADFMNAHPAEAIAWVNPIAPLQPADEVRAIVDHFRDEALDSLITVDRKQVHCLYGDTPVNFSFDGKFAQTQELTPVLPFVYSVMMWRCAPFLADMRARGYAFFCGKFGAYPVGRLSSLIVKNDGDLLICDAIARLRGTADWSLSYDPLADQAEVRRG
jgi:CMP-N-acetylneuraminic acid synthetase